VIGLRHPILERLVTVPYVAHTINLESSILLYGMNASGKSSLMKAIGLCTVLAQAGFPVPATSLRLSPFTAIFTRILGNDNLWAGLSSFAVEMTEFREILRHADERSLVLGDELCSGTESLSATALVAAGVETLVRRRSKFVFATHLHELASMPDIAGLAGVSAFHLKVSYDAATDVLVYDRSLAPGSGSALYGLEVCRALDLPTEFLDRATAIRRALGGAVTAHRSVYSAGAVVDACAVCGGADRLETHHIVAQAAGGSDAAGNLVCLCARCHDDHHGGRLDIRGWEETSAGRRLVFVRGAGSVSTEVTAWIREQHALKIPVATIQRMARQIHGVEVTAKEVRAVH
jgi:DNA mismatch repair protein MutS